MAINKTSVAYMKDYLKFALEFEKYVYIWSNAMIQTQKQLSDIRNHKNLIQQSQLSSQRQLSTLDYDFEQYSINEQNVILKYKNRSRIWLIVAIIWLIFSVLVASGYVLLSPDISERSLLVKIIFFIFIAFMYFCLSLFIGPICLYQHYKNKKTYKRLKNKTQYNSSDLKVRKRNALLEESKQTSASLSNILREENTVAKKQNEISIELQKAKRKLDEIYSLNALPIKYRNFNAVATLYEYLDTGRCNIVQGHGGIYDTYETERISLEQLAQMVMMNQTLNRIEDNQRYICNELRIANQTLSNINSSIKNIEKTNAVIAKNTAISAIANQQTARATSWLAWSAWANGY